MKGARTLAASLVIACVGCAQVPQAAIDVSKQVSSGIVSLGQNGAEMVAGWEEAVLILLDERWPQIYKAAETEYRSKRGLAPATPLSSTQQEELASLAALIRDASRKRVAIKANEFRKLLAANTKTTLEANESVTDLLVSANSTLKLQQTAVKQITEHGKLPGDLAKLVSELTKLP